MKPKIKKLIKLTSIITIILLLFSITSFAEENTQNIENKITKADLNLYGKSCILVETSTNRIAYEKNSQEKMYPASTTKVLTAIIALETCQLTDTVTITYDMISKVPAGYTSAYLRPGEKVTVEQLLNVLLIPSANDAGFALAIHISGSVEEFAKLMNQKAAQIGCQNSHFTNPSGIHDVNHYSTAKDLAIIALYAKRFPQIMDIGCKTSYILQPENSKPRTFETTNSLIKPDEKTYYEFATGLKTGFTDPAGSCIISTAKKDDMDFVAIVLDAPAPSNGIVYRDLDCKSLFEYGFTNYEEITKVEPQVVEFVSNSFTSGVKISTIFKISLSLLGIFLFCVIIKTRKCVRTKCKN